MKLGLAPSKQDKTLRALVNNSFQSLHVTRRGAISVDPAEVTRKPSFIKARAQARQVVENQSAPSYSP